MITEAAISSGLLTGSAVINPRPCRLTDLSIFTDGANQATVIIYDNASGASGNVLSKAVVAGAALVGGNLIPHPIRAGNGIYMSLSVANAGTAGVIVTFDPQHE